MEISMSNIKDSLSKEKKEQENWKLLNKLIFRPLSYYFTYILLRLGLSANQTTLLSFIFGVIAIILLSIPYNIAQYTGMVGLFIWQLLEFCDGNIARFKKTNSLKGAIIDDLNAQLIKLLIPISLGFYSYYNFSDSIFRSYWYPFIGCLIAFINILIQCQTQICSFVLKQKSIIKWKYSKKNKLKFIVIIGKRIILAFIKMSDLGLLILFIFIIMNLQNYYLLINLIIMIMFLIYEYTVFLKMLLTH